MPVVLVVLVVSVALLILVVLAVDLTGALALVRGTGYWALGTGQSY